MNIIGQIGQFMIDNQDIIGTIVLIALVAILLWLLISFMVRRHRKRKWENSERAELLGEVKKLSANNKILLDTLNRVGDEETVAETLKQIELNDSITSNIASEVGEDIANVEEAGEALDAAVEKAQDANGGLEKAEPALAYMSRDANVDKFGNVYTEEMLRDQIG